MWTQRLRTVLRLNAATSVIGGLIAIVDAGWVSDTLGIDQVTITRLIGIGLVLFGADVWFLSRQSRAKLVAGAALVSIADGAWVAATIVVLGLQILTTPGTVTAIVLGVGVADFALAQLWLRAKAGAGAEEIEPELESRPENEVRPDLGGLASRSASS